MEKFSKWRDPSTGIQPFLPLVAPSTVSPIIIALLTPFSAAHALISGLLLAVVLLLHVLLVEGVCLVLVPIKPFHRAVSSLFNAITCRLALGIMGYYWIEHDMVSPKRSSTSIAQSTRPPRSGDLIICNYTSYIDILYLSYRYNPIFLLPVFAPLPDSSFSSSSSSSSSQPTGLTGRHTGTGSAQLTQSLPQPPCIGYTPISLLSLLARTGTLPPTSQSSSPSLGGSFGPGNLDNPIYSTLREASIHAGNSPIVSLPESTTSNNRAILRFPAGVLADNEFSGPKGPWKGQIFIIYFKHPSPTIFSPSATCPTPNVLGHLIGNLLWTPNPLGGRNLSVKTLHPSASPSSPSFSPGEILANAPGGLEGLSSGTTGNEKGGQGGGVWREAIATVLAETGRVRRVRGMGWVEKSQFLEYYYGGVGSRKKR